MALIKCKNCGHIMSDKAANCPHCGSEQIEYGPTSNISFNLFRASGIGYIVSFLVIVFPIIYTAITRDYSNELFSISQWIQTIIFDISKILLFLSFCYMTLKAPKKLIWAIFGIITLFLIVLNIFKISNVSQEIYNIIWWVNIVFTLGSLIYLISQIKDKKLLTATCLFLISYIPTIIRYFIDIEYYLDTYAFLYWLGVLILLAFGIVAILMKRKNFI